jgi:hypothetical protein
MGVSRAMEEYHNILEMGEGPDLVITFPLDSTFQ